MNEHKLVFIGGLHRSGTSLLFKCLRDHPQISGFQDTGVPEDEGQHLQSVYPAAKRYGGPGRFGLDSSSYLDETSELVSENNARQIFAQWQRHLDLRKPVLLEKSPPNLIRTRFLQALFPNSYFIVLLRHPVATTYATKKWRRRMSVYTLLKHWLICHEQFNRDRRHIRSYYVQKYEDLVRNPEESLDKIYQFLGVAQAPLTQKIRPNINDKYLASWQKAKKGLLTRLYVRYMVGRFEDRVNEFGYSLKDLSCLEPYAGQEEMTLSQPTLRLREKGIVRG